MKAESIIYPFEKSNVSYWTKRWGISSRQLNDAILETGSLNVVDLRKTLQSHCGKSFRGVIAYLRLSL